MAEVHDVVAQQLVIAGRIQVSGVSRSRLGLCQERIVRDQFRIGLFCGTHPDPNGKMPLHHRIGFDSSRCRYFPVSVRIAYASTGFVELQAMIGAANHITASFTHGQWREAVGSAVTYSYRGAVVLAVEQNRFIEDFTVKQFLSRNLVGPGGHVSSIAKVMVVVFLVMTDTCVSFGRVVSRTSLFRLVFRRNRLILRVGWISLLDCCARFASMLVPSGCFMVLASGEWSFR